MRLLHTSDWHLGARTGPVARAPDHDLFLSWLTQTLQEEQVDVLVVAGDVFDQAQPSSEAQRQYYRFLAGLPATGVRDVVIVGGNHDSPSRLDAPADLLGALNIHVVGALPDSDDDAILPLRVRGGDVAAVCLAVPYVHEYRLGVRTTDLDHAAVRAAFRTTFRELYTRLADQAAARFPGLPIVATGHLTLGTASTREDYPQEIHQVGYVEGLPPDILDPRIAYTALGHIHRSYPPGGSAWYSGSPIVLSLPEARSPRRVLLVDLAADQPARVTPLTVPPTRDLVLLEGDQDALVAQLSALRSALPLAPLVQLRLHADVHDPHAVSALQSALEQSGASPTPVIVELRTLTAGAAAGDGLPEVVLAELSPADVLARMLVGREDADAVLRAFAELQSWNAETAEARVASVGTA